MCMLKHAFESNSLLGLVYRIISGDFDPIRRDVYSEELNSLIKRILTRDATQRPSVTEILREEFVRKQFFSNLFLIRGRKVLLIFLAFYSSESFVIADFFYFDFLCILKGVEKLPKRCGPGCVVHDAKTARTTHFAIASKEFVKDEKYRA